MTSLEPFERDFEKLKNQPSSDDVESILKKFDDISPNSSIYLTLIQLLLYNTIPESYIYLPIRVKDLIKDKLRSLSGIGGMLNMLEVSSRILSDSNKHLAQLMIQILIELFDSQLVLTLLNKHEEDLERKEIEKLVFRGKCFGVISEASYKYDLNVDNNTFGDSDKYAAYLSSSILSLYGKSNVKLINSFLNSARVFNSNVLLYYYDCTFNETQWPKFLESYNLLKRFERKGFTRALFSKFISRRYLQDTCTDEEILALSSLLTFTCDLLDDTFFLEICKLQNTKLNSLVSLIESAQDDKKYDAIIFAVLNSWSDEGNIKSEPISQQECKTHLLLCLLHLKGKGKFLSELLRSPLLLTAISNRLSSFSNHVKSLGIIVADSVSVLSEQKKIFNIELPREFTYLTEENSYLLSSTKDVKIDSAWKVVNLPRIEENDEQVTVINDDRNTSEKGNVVDSDDESDDDDTVYDRNNVTSPIYIKDLLNYLNADPQSAEAYEMTRLALTTGPTLIRQKKNFGNEVSFYSEDLLTLLVGLSNNFQDKDFEELKLNCMIAIIASDPPSVLHLYKLLLTGDYSLQQRMMILSSSSLAARELKGFKDEVVTKSFSKKVFPSKELPPQVHRALLGNENLKDSLDTTSEIQRSIQNDLMHGTSEDFKDELSGGKILRMSRKLTKKQAPVCGGPIIKNYAKVISSYFYFPLVEVWYKAGGVNIGHYTPIFIAHYVKTLTLLLHAAYPTATDLPDMTKEFFLIIVPILLAATHDQLQVIESIVTGTLLVLDITDDRDILNNYHNELQKIKNWVSVFWESIIDDKVKSLCASLLLRLSKVEENLERLLIDQMNSMY